MWFLRSKLEPGLEARVRPTLRTLARLLFVGWTTAVTLYGQLLTLPQSLNSAPSSRPYAQSAAAGGSCSTNSTSLETKREARRGTLESWLPSSCSQAAYDSAHSHASPSLVLPRSLTDADERSAVNSFALSGFDGSDPYPNARDRGSQTKKSRKSSAVQGSPGHIFWVVPAFKVDYLKNIEPLTPRQKFKLWARGAYDPLGFAGTAVESAAEYSKTDGFCGYGKTFGAYWKCLGSAQLDANDSSFFGDFVFTVLMHQDPRYFPLGKGPFVRRLLYSISRVFVTRSDKTGKPVFYSSALAGTVLAAAVSNLYYPRQDRGFSLTLSRMGWDLGQTEAFNLAAEYWPTIHSKLHGAWHKVTRLAASSDEDDGFSWTP